MSEAKLPKVDRMGAVAGVRGHQLQGINPNTFDIEDSFGIIGILMA